MGIFGPNMGIGGIFCPYMGIEWSCWRPGRGGRRRGHHESRPRAVHVVQAECDVSVSKLLGFETFPIFRIVSDSVLKKFGIKKSIRFGIGKNLVSKKYRIRYRKNLVSKKYRIRY